MLETLVQAEPAACVCVLDLPADAAHGAYYPYDGVIRPVPGVFVDSATGPSLRARASRRPRAAGSLLTDQERADPEPAWPDPRSDR